MLYQLYDTALKLEPAPKEKELTFSQRMMVNRARGFITKKMLRRDRVHQLKRNKKLMQKISRAIQSQLQTRSMALAQQIKENGQNGNGMQVIDITDDQTKLILKEAVTAEQFEKAKQLAMQ